MSNENSDGPLAWNAQWRGWGQAFRTRRSFLYASAFGGIALITLVLIVLIVAALFSTQQFGASTVLALLGNGVLFLSILSFLVIYVASRFMDPEVRLFGGFSNLRLGRTILFSLALGLTIYAMVTLSSAYLINGLQTVIQVFARRQTYFVGLATTLQLIGTILLLGIFQITGQLAIRFCLRWPQAAESSRVPYRHMIRSPKFIFQSLLIGFGLWLVWSAITATSIAVSIFTLFFAILTAPLFYVLVSGYTIMILAATFLAPFRAGGWCLKESENLIHIFE